MFLFRMGQTFDKTDNKEQNPVAPQKKVWKLIFYPYNGTDLAGQGHPSETIYVFNNSAIVFLFKYILATVVQSVQSS